MSKHWITTLLSLFLVSLLFFSCKKNYSKDDPLPTSYYPSIIINSDNQVVYAIDPATGKKNWEFSMPELYGVPTTVFTPSPLLYNGMVYLTAINSDTVYKVNAKTGKIVKKIMFTPYGVPFPNHVFFVVATPVADGNLIYVPTSNDTIYAIDTGSGNVKWKFDAKSPLSSSPTVFNGKVYVATTGGHVYCLDKTNGPDVNGLPVWDYPGATSPTTGSFISSPAISAPYLYVGSAIDSNMYCIYLNSQQHTSAPGAIADTGTLRWKFKTLGNIYSSPTAFGGLCIFGCHDFYVYCLDTQTSTAKWKFRTNSRVNSSPIIDNQTVYIGSDDYFLYALYILDGAKKWSFKANGTLKSSPVPYNGSIYIGSFDGNLYAVDSAKGTLKWKYYINGNIECSPVVDNLTNTNTNVSQVSGFIN